MIGLAFLIMAAAVSVTLLSARLAAKLSRILREKVFEKVMSFTNSEFDKFSTASLITRSTNDIQQIQMFMTMLFRIVVYAPLMGIGGTETDRPIKLSNKGNSYWTFRNPCIQYRKT